MKIRKNLLEREKSQTGFTYSLILASTITGLITYLLPLHSTWLQWQVIAHLFISAFLSYFLISYAGIHLVRTIGFRRPSVLISGFLSLLILFSFLGSGWHLLIYGQTEANKWIYHVHVYSALLFVLSIIIHIALHVVLFPAKRKQNNTEIFQSFSKKHTKNLLIVNGGIQIVLIVATFLYELNDTPYSTDPVTENYEYSYGDHPFRPSQTETFHGKFVDAREVADSHRCASCHADIAEQWISSVHQQAASDPTYVTNVSLLAEKKGIAATRYCEGCHAPVALLTGELSPGGLHGGMENSPAHHEGVSCMSCHGIKKLVHLKGVASYEFSGSTDYLFAKSDNPILRRVHDRLIKVKPDQHIRDLTSPLIEDPKFCASCHTQFMDKDMNNWGWVKMQDEYKAWVNSPYANSHDESFSSSTVSRCQDCHMPLVHSDDPSADKNAKVRAHHFPGANTFLPLLRGDKKQFDATVKFLQANKMRISIDKPTRTDNVQTLHSIDESLRNTDEAPFFFYLGETINLQMIVTNQGVGHDFPGGTVDINEAWLDFIVRDAEGEVVYHSGFMNEDNTVDVNAHFYRSLPIDRQGKLVWRHDLFNMVGEAFKRVIPAGESDLVTYSFEVPSWAKSPLTASATLKYKKLNERYAKWALKEKYITIPPIDMAWDSLQIPIKVRKPVESSALSMESNVAPK